MDGRANSDAEHSLVALLSALTSCVSALKERKHDTLLSEVLSIGLWSCPEVSSQQHGTNQQQRVPAAGLQWALCALPSALPHPSAEQPTPAKHGMHNVNSCSMPRSSWPTLTAGGLLAALWASRLLQAWGSVQHHVLAPTPPPPSHTAARSCCLAVLPLFPMQDVRGATLELMVHIMVANAAFIQSCLKVLLFSLLPPPALPAQEQLGSAWAPDPAHLKVQDQVVAALEKVRAFFGYQA